MLKECGIEMQFSWKQSYERTYSMNSKYGHHIDEIILKGERKIWQCNLLFHV